MAGFLGCGNVPSDVVIGEGFVDNVAEGRIC